LRKQLIKKAVLAGIVSGVFLGLFFKGVEEATLIKVYTLLLNVDYVPVIKNYSVPEMIEFIIHLVISVVISIGFLLFYSKRQTSSEKRILSMVLVSLLIGILLYPTTVLSSRTPSITSISASSYWLLGHMLYGWLLGFLLRKN
jgi:uncharacterized membrane protein